jgi:hypothetical protein
VSRPNDTIRVVIPLAIRRRNGRPTILPPEDVAVRQARTQDPHILKALGRAWAWRRKLESGEMATVGDIANVEKVTDRFVSRTMRLAYLCPDALRLLLLAQESPAITCGGLVMTATKPWIQQTAHIFGSKCDAQ